MLGASGVVLLLVLLALGASVVFQWASRRSGFFNIALGAVAGVCLVAALAGLLVIARAWIGW